MSKEKFHVGWFLDGFRAPAWNRAWSGHSTRDWPTGQFYMDMARDLERGCFDYFMLEDSNYIPDIYGGSMDVYLKYGRRAPKHDPAALAAIISQVTTRLGIIATIATTESTPFQVARLMSTLDHISSGRIGWNVVTGSNDRAAQNFGRDAQPEHDQRYEMADEFVAAVRALWDSWKEDAVIMDEVSGVYVDASKVNTADYNGTYFRTRGPLNTVPSPQHHPVLVQAGVSSRGQKFSAENADSIIAVAKDFASMRTLRENIRRHAAAVGRNPDHIKVLFLAEPVLGETDDEARAKVKRMQDERARALDWSLETAASVTTVDFSQYDPDQPLPKDLTTNGHQGILNDMVSSGKTLRELAAAENNVGDFVGTPETVAGIMEEIAQEIGGDGFLLTTPRVTRRYVTEIVDGLIPALQKRGVVRTHYEHELLRDNLTAF
jgi:FMN-dependent oxidoreductase (nitrilotriacetate monooxygenase family)